MSRIYFLLAVFFVIATPSESRLLHLTQAVKHSTKKTAGNKSSTGASQRQKVSSTLKVSKDSQTLTVKTALKQYTLQYDKNKISIKGYRLNLNLNRKQCNGYIIDRFNNDIAKFIKEQIKTKALQKTVKKASIKTIEIQIGKEVYFATVQSKAGNTFLALPDEISRMKWEEKIACTQKNSD